MSQSQNIDIYKTILREEQKDQQTFWIKTVTVLTSLGLGVVALAFC